MIKFRPYEGLIFLGGALGGVRFTIAIKQQLGGGFKVFFFTIIWGRFPI